MGGGEGHLYARKVILNTDYTTLMVGLQAIVSISITFSAEQKSGDLLHS